MRIVISGAHNTGKTTLIKEFLQLWPQYKTPEKTYRDYLSENRLEHSSKTTTETQAGILNFMIEQFEATKKGDKIIFDRGPLDNLAYTMWANAANIEGFTDEFVQWSIKITKELLRKIDIVFLVRYDKAYGLTDDGLRDVTPGYVEDIDLIFNAFKNQYEQNFDADIFFPANDSPALIELPNSLQGRLQGIRDYIGNDGELIGGEGESILDPKNITALEALVNQQILAQKQEKKEAELFKKFKV